MEGRLGVVSEAERGVFDRESRIELRVLNKRERVDEPDSLDMCSQDEWSGRLDWSLAVVYLETARGLLLVSRFSTHVNTIFRE